MHRYVPSTAFATCHVPNPDVCVQMEMPSALLVDVFDTNPAKSTEATIYPTEHTTNERDVYWSTIAWDTQLVALCLPSTEMVAWICLSFVADTLRDLS